MANALYFAKNLFSAANIQSHEWITVYEKKHKIVVFVPVEHVDDITFAMAGAGAGKIGNYAVCSFRVNGIGTFKGGKSSNPTIGKRGILEKVPEVRLEMICDSNILDKVIKKMLGVHPYEEPAFEIYNVMTAERSNLSCLELSLKNPVSIKYVLIKINKKIDTGMISGTKLKKRFKTFVIDFSRSMGKTNTVEYSPPGAVKISKSKSGDFNISFK